VGVTYTQEEVDEIVNNLRNEIAEKIANRYDKAYSLYKEMSSVYHEGQAYAYDIAEQIARNEL